MHELARGDANGTNRNVETNGWRAGKPFEDPEKQKRWGRISARPSEYLIHVRRGRVLTATSGQGASCFKLPWDSVAVIPTTVQKLRFFASQITSEKAGVEVTGLAVYRIADPLIAYRMLNFSFPERASEKLAEVLTDMFAGATRRLVANMTLEDCLARRKESIGVELMREIAPVVSGRGMVEDDTDRGWGVVVDTIEIQDVRILSASVFGDLQALYRKDLERRAREAALETERAIKIGEAEATRGIELTRIASEREVGERQRAADEQAKLEEIAKEARLGEARMETERAGEAARHAAEMDALAHEAQRVRQRIAIAEARRELAEIDLAVMAVEARKKELEIELGLLEQRGLRAIDNTISRERIDLAVAERLPQIAAAFQQQMGQVHVTAIDGSNPFGFVAAAVEGVLGIARSAGLRQATAEAPAVP